EFSPIDQRSSIIAHDRVGGRGLRPRAFLQDLVLKAARQSNHAFLSFVRREKCVAFFLVRFALRLHLRLHLCSQFILCCCHGCLGLFLRQQSLAPGERGL